MEVRWGGGSVRVEQVSSTRPYSKTVGTNEWHVIGVCVCVRFIRSGQNHLARHSERGKKTRWTKKEVGRQHQGMDRPGVRQGPEGSGEQGKMVAKSSVVPKRPSRLRD